jgi:hypothetical protein
LVFLFPLLVVQIVVPLFFFWHLKLVCQGLGPLERDEEPDIGEELSAFSQAPASGVAEHAHPHVVHQIPTVIVVVHVQQLLCELASVVDDTICFFFFEVGCFVLDLV